MNNDLRQASRQLKETTLRFEGRKQRKGKDGKDRKERKGRKGIDKEKREGKDGPVIG